MRKLITTIAALALAVATYGQVNTLTGTLKETFNGSFAGNFYDGTYTWNSGTFVYMGATYDDNYNTTLTGGVKAYQLASGTVIGSTMGEYGIFATTPNSPFNLGSFLSYIIGTGASNTPITLSSITGSMKVINKSNIPMPIQVSFTNELVNTGGFGDWNNPLERNISSYTVPANSTKYIVLSSVPPQFNSIRFRVTSFTGAVAIDDLRFGYALPTAVTALIEANNSTTVAGGGTLTFAIPSVTGSLEYANEIPTLSVSPTSLGEIDENGIFTAGATSGVVTITATSYGISSNYPVTILGAVYITSATITGASALTVGSMATYSISGTTPSNAQAPTLTVYKSSNLAVATINGTTGVLKAISAGTTTVFALHTLSNSTVITASGVTLSVSSVTGLSAGLSASDFSVAPNPTTDAVSVSAPVAVSGLKVYSLTGVEVASSSTASVSLSGASAGVYILEISTANGSVFKRVIKE